MDEEKLEVKSTDMIIIRYKDHELHGFDNAYHTAQQLHDLTGALVMVTESDTNVEQLPEEDARRVWQVLQERFG